MLFLRAPNLGVGGTADSQSERVVRNACYDRRFIRDRVGWVARVVARSTANLQREDQFRVKL